MQPPDYDWSCAYPAYPAFTPDDESVEVFCRRVDHYAREVKRVARLEDACARRISGVRAKTIDGDRHYHWLIAHQMGRMTFEEIAEFYKVNSTASVFEAVKEVARQVEIAVLKLLGGRKQATSTLR